MSFPSPSFSLTINSHSNRGEREEFDSDLISLYYSLLFIFSSLTTRHSLSTSELLINCTFVSFLFELNLSFHSFPSFASSKMTVGLCYSREPQFAYYPAIFYKSLKPCILTLLFIREVGDNSE